MSIGYFGMNNASVSSISYEYSVFRYEYQVVIEYRIPEYRVFSIGVSGRFRVSDILVKVSAK